MSNITTVLFDLDGTLADTADDLGFYSKPNVIKKEV